MSWLVTAKQYIPAVIGEEFGGGYFAGYISHTADGNPTHALIVAPGATGQSSLQWKTANTATPGTSSEFDGAANTAAMVTAGIADHPAAQFCVNLDIGGYTDWYLPSRRELDIAYFNLKPGTANNGTSVGINDYSVPKRTVNYILTYPLQTYVSEFKTSPNAFSASNYWSSTESTNTAGWTLNFFQGGQNSGTGKSNNINVRAFRRITL
jgi:hypothetical protein